MDRQIFYPNQILDDVDLLTVQRNSLIGFGWLAQSLLATTSTVVSGLSCAPTSPAGMSVQVGTGAIYSLQNLDNVAYGSLGSDVTSPHQIIKQGLNLALQTLACPAPTNAGQSIVYLIQAGYQDYDTGSAVLQYFNASNPSVAFTGPNNNGSAQNTTRQGLCSLLAKGGVAASTGSQTAPSPDSGYVGLYAVTVAFGQTTITSGNIQQLPGAPFIGTPLRAGNNLSDLTSLSAALGNLGFAQLLTGNGYVQLPGGVTLQWGTVNVGPDLSSHNFPVPFSSACFVVGVFSGAVSQIVTTTTQSATGFSVQSNAGSIYGCFYIAVGH